MSQVATIERAREPAVGTPIFREPAPTSVRRIVLRTAGRKRGPIARLMSPSDIGEMLKPFVFLDHAEVPHSGSELAGIHPHSGIATLTTVLQGGLVYEDTTGKQGEVPTGGLEWMKAGGGVWHDGGALKGDPLRVFQLWVALPPAAENSAPESQYISPRDVQEDGAHLGALGEGSNIRLFAGLRFAHFKGDGSLSTHYSSFGPFRSDVDIKRKFTGIGPRIGFDAMLPLAEQFSLDVGAAGAVLFGKQKFESHGNYSAFGTEFSENSESRSKNAVVPNLEASAAFSWLITDNAKFSLGYRVDSYWDVYDNGTIFDGRDEGDRIIHGPFIKLTIGTGGGG